MNFFSKTKTYDEYGSFKYVISIFMHISCIYKLIRIINSKNFYFSFIFYIKRRMQSLI